MTCTLPNAHAGSTAALGIHATTGETADAKGRGLKALRLGAASQARSAKQRKLVTLGLAGLSRRQLHAVEEGWEKQCRQCIDNGELATAVWGKEVSGMVAPDEDLLP